MWHHGEVVTALSGMNAEVQLRENVAVADAALASGLTASEHGLAEEVRRFYRERVRVPCTTCGYCLPCPSGVLIPDVFSLVNTVAMFDSRAATSASYRAIWVARGSGAHACAECGECEPKCPQSIPIRDALRAAHELLG